MKIDNNINIKQGGTQILKVMQGNIQVWPYNDPWPPTICTPASTATEFPVKYASELVPYGTYALYCNGLWAKIWGEKHGTNYDILMSEGKEDMLILTAVPKQDLPELAGGNLYIRNTGATLYTGCAYVFKARVDSDDYWLTLGLSYSYLAPRENLIYADCFIDFLDPAVNADGYMIGTRKINETDSSCSRMALGTYAGQNVIQSYYQNYYSAIPQKSSSIQDWLTKRIEIISTDYIQDYN